MLYIGTPFVCVAGILLANFRATRIFKSATTSMWLSCEIELKARYTLHSFLFDGHPFEEHDAMGTVRHRRRGPSASADIENSGVLGQISEKNEVHMQHSVVPIDAGGLEAIDDIGTQGKIVRGLLNRTQLSEIESIFVVGCQAFGKSAQVHASAAQFYTHIAQNSHLHLTYLLHASRLSPQLDILFFIRQSRRDAAEASDRIHGARGNASSRLIFDNLLALARLHVEAAMRSHASFWSLLMSPMLDMKALHKVSEEMSSSSKIAEATLTKVMKINSQSQVALRLYAEFTLYVCNNVSKVK